MGETGTSAALLSNHLGADVLLSDINKSPNNLSVKKDLIKYSKKVEEKVIAIKLNETKDLIKPLCKKSNVHDDNVTNLLNYYELINELKTIHG